MPNGSTAKSDNTLTVNAAENTSTVDRTGVVLVLACQKSLLEGKIPDQELAEDRLTIAKALLRGNYEHKRIISFLEFLKNFLYV